MSNQAIKRTIGTLQNELQFYEGQAILSGTVSNGVTVVVNGLTGSRPQVLSGSSTYQFTSQYPVSRVQSGSYVVQFNSVFPKLLSAQFTLGCSGSQNTAFAILQDTGVPVRWDSVTGAGVNQVGFQLVSGSSRVLADPTSPVVVNISIAFANSLV